MKGITLITLLLSGIGLFADPGDKTKPIANVEPFHIEKSIIVLSSNWDAAIMELAEYNYLSSFCRNEGYRTAIFDLLDQIHAYHDQLEMELQTTTNNHSKRTIKRILNHMDVLEEKFHPDDFYNFFNEQCISQYQIEKNAKYYKSSFAHHSYSSQTYVQEVVIYRYVNRMTRRIRRIKKHVEHFYIRRKVWEHG